VGSTLNLVLSGGPGFAQIAITNLCNARCDFCGFAVGKVKKPDFRSVTLEGVRDTCDILYEKGIRFLTFTGGEPMAHPDLLEMLAYAGKKGLHPALVTNGSLLDDDACLALARAGVQTVLISIDAPDAAAHEKNRGLPGVCEKIQRANARLGELGVTRTASVTVSKLVGDYGALPPFLRDLGFDSLTFSYPLRALHSTYLAFGSSSLLEYDGPELIERFREIQRLKPKFPIMNPSESLNEMIRHVRGEKSRYPCLAGHKYFFIDWNLNVYRCHFLPEPICSIYDFPRAAPIRDHCDLCMIDCYRDPSVLQHAAVAFADAVEHLRRGRLWRALRALADRRTIDSLRAIVEARSWLVRWRRRPPARALPGPAIPLGS
jgi:MoaA/NifB/PqqE/SkfB family radical SAM enzyme